MKEFKVNVTGEVPIQLTVRGTITIKAKNKSSAIRMAKHMRGTQKYIRSMRVRFNKNFEWEDCTREIGKYVDMRANYNNDIQFINVSDDELAEMETRNGTAVEA